MGGFFTLSTPELRRRCQAIAVLDAIASPEWEGRRYSWNPSWDDGEQVLEGRDGQGDSLLILFRDESLAINLFSMEGQLIEVMPGAFEKFFLGEPVATLGTTSYWWRVGNGGDWCGNPTTDAPDWLRLIADGRDSYLNDAEDYFDDSLNYTRAASAVASLIYDFTSLTRTWCSPSPRTSTTGTNSPPIWKRLGIRRAGLGRLGTLPIASSDLAALRLPVQIQCPIEKRVCCCKIVWVACLIDLHEEFPAVAIKSVCVILFLLDHLGLAHNDQPLFIA